MRAATLRQGPVPSRLLLIGLGACALALLATLIGARAALAGWLAAFLFWSSFPIGTLPLLLMIYLIPGGWRDELEPAARAALLLLPLALLAALPILFGAGALFPWAGVAREGFQHIYLTPWFLALRTLVFFASMGATVLLLVARPAWSTPVAAIGLIVFVLLHTVFAVDWLMSLNPDFHSSGFGLYVLSIQMTTALAGLILISLAADPHLKTGLLASLLLTALLLWAYVAFMQYIIIWSGDLPRGVAWYQQRGVRSWPSVEAAIGACGLGPAFLLLFPPVRASRAWVCVLASVTLLGKVLEFVWLVMPGFADLTVALPAALLALIGLSALSVAVFAVAGEWASVLPRRSRKAQRT
jgi:hypothetical protein